MEKVTSFKTSDGRLFDNKTMATMHEAKIALADAIKAEYAPVFVAVPDCDRLLFTMMQDPQFYITALQTYSKAKQRFESKTASA